MHIRISGLLAAGGAGGVSAGGAAGSTMEGGVGGGTGSAVTKVVPTAGCGMAPPAAFTPGTTSAVQTIVTMGVKPAGCSDSLCGPWTYTRDYYVTLPAGYMNTKAYPLVFQGPGCGGKGTDVYPLTYMGQPNVNNTVIRVGLTPSADAQ